MKIFMGVILALVLLRVEGGKPSIGYCDHSSCFTAHAGTLDFNSAQKSCESKRGSLMTVRTPEANSLISNLLTGFSGHFWIGLIHRGESCSDPSLDLKGYTWITGDEPSLTFFENWKNKDSVCSQRCVSITKDDPQWAERHCNDATDVEGYLCEHQNTNKCTQLTSESSVLYETPFGFSKHDLGEVPHSSNATRLDLGTKYICLEGEWLKAPWNCEVYKGGCEHDCDKRNNSYICTCPPGYKLESNAVSCGKAQDDPCHKAGCSHSCLSKGKDYACLCGSGFALDVDGKTCKDINECDDRLCPGKYFHCVNMIGGFECRCMNGFKKELDICIDDDECESGPCDHSCNNTIGSYHCECWEGYKVSSEDRHICALYCPQWECPAVDCDPNNPFQCNCPRGFILEERPTGLICTDIDECEMLYCDQHCRNIIGGYICSCDEGFTVFGSTKCLKTDIVNGSGTSTTIDLFTPISLTPTEIPSSMSTAGLAGTIVVCSAVVMFLMACLVLHLMKCCRTIENLILAKSCNEDVHDLQQVTTGK
uniref:Thrombomodulin n=1 Tax=Astyanax mexicanus TaxID=7994 RepID=A0A3B1K3B4_ASTMX